MKKVTLVAIALVIAMASSAYAIQIASVSKAPIVGGIAQSVDIDPGYAPVVDPITQLPKVDPATGLQLQARTWANYMYFASPSNGGHTVQLQSVSLQKIIPQRKVACGAGWATGSAFQPIIVQQQGINDVNLHWPLLYEVNGVEIRLTVQYTTSDRVAYPSSFGPNIASRSHLETYSWFVVSKTWDAFNARLAFFAALPAGTCETFAVTPMAVTKIRQYINGYGSTYLGTYQPGILNLLALNQPVAAGARFADLETYLDSVCTTTCGGLYGAGINAGTPDAYGEAILDNPTVPANSVLLNDLWAVGKTLNVLIDKK